MTAWTTNADDQEQAPLPEAIADERGAGERHRAEQRFLPEAGLERVGDRREPGRVGREHVGVEQRLGRRPPAEVLRRDEIEHHVVGEEDRDEQEPADGAPEDLDRGARDGRGSSRRTPRPGAPQLRVMPKARRRQRLGRHERQREERREADEAGDDERRLLREEGRARDRRVVGHPVERELVDQVQRLEHADRHAPDRGVPPQHPALPHHEEQPDADAADHVEQHQADHRADADGVVGRIACSRSGG